MYLGRSAARALKVTLGGLGKLLLPVGRGLFSWLFVKPYSLVWRYHRSLRAILPHINLPALLRHHQVVLYLALAGTVLVTANNLRIRTAEAREFGQHNLLLPLLEQEFSATDQLTGDAVDLLGVPAGSNGQLQLPNDVPFTLNESGAAILKPFLVTTQPGVAGRTNIEEYIVQPGDTLTAIAQRFQLNLTTLLWENRLTERSILRIGEKLSILPVNGVSYRIGRGDTVAKIAQRYRVRADDVTAFNRLSGALTVGSTIIIPGGRPPAPAAPPRPAAATAPTPAATAPASATPSSTRLQWPTVGRRITQYFTWRHGGVDIANSRGTPVYAAESGVVEVAGWNRGGYGYYIIIDHGGGLKTLYAHNTKLHVTVGDRVERGQQIADMGSTGRSTGPHVHFEVLVQGRRQNPLNYTR